MKKNSSLMGAGLLTAVASSLCCITPVLALVSGTTGMASTFVWLEPLRPYLIGFTVLVLVFAWYQKLKPQSQISCQCEGDEKETSFFQTKSFLGIVTVFAIVMTLFPYYSSVFYPEHQEENTFVNKENVKTIEVGIEGMTCASCEEHITHSVYELNGVTKAITSYEKGNAFIAYDSSRVSMEDIRKAINNTGYSVKDIVKTN